MKIKVVIFFTLVLGSGVAFSDSVAPSTGGFAGSGSGFSSSNFSSSFGNNSSTSTAAAPSGSGATNITINGALPQASGGNQTQILGSDVSGSSQQNKDLITNVAGRRDDLYNTYNALGGSGQSGGYVMYNGRLIAVPDEFQLDVQMRTGQMFNRYGYDLFNDPSTFAPVENSLAPANYILGPGDQISIKAWGSIDVVYTTEVDKEGNVFIPKVGKISLIGIKASDLDNYLKTKIGKIYRNFSLIASISRIRSIQVNVTGFARRPGTYTISSLSTLSNALFATGGPSPQGSLRHIQVKRNGMIVADYDMYNLLLKGDNSGDVKLISGDIIYIRPYGRQVAIYDGVKVPGIYEVRDGETVADAVKFAGGYTFNNNKQELIIEKTIANKQIDVFNYSFADGLKQQLENGEIIHFFRMPNRYNDAIVLIGNVANPSRFQWRQGITVKDIIPNKELLLTKSFWNSYSYNTYARDKLLDSSGREKTNNWSGANAQINQFSSGLNNANNSGLSAFGGGDNLFTAGPIAIPEADINWHYAVLVRLDPETYRSILIPFDLEAALNGDPKNNLKLEPGDIINILSSKDVRNPSKKGVVYVFIDGEVNRPGVYELKPGSTMIDAIKTAGGVTSDAYFYGIELDRETVKKRQKAALDQMLDNIQQTLLSQANNSTTDATSSDQIALKNQILASQQAFINKMKQLKPSGRIVLGLKPTLTDIQGLPSITLENGDTLHVPPMPSTIDVIGQVYNPATFMYNKSNSVGNYIDMAGTPNNFADTSSIYILHADGTLYSKQQTGWYSAFNTHQIYPGDAIVVPQRIEFSTFTKNLIDWTQVLANFGLGVAAVRQLGS